MEINNNLPDKEFRNPIDSSQLSYKGDNEEGNPVSEATDNSPMRNPQHVRNEAPALKNTPKPQGKNVQSRSKAKSLICCNLKILELIYKRNLVLVLTQENSIENFVQDCLPYILNYHSLCYYFSSLP